MSFLSDACVDVRMDYFSNPFIMHHTHTHPQYEIYFCPNSIEQISVINGVKYNYKYPCVIISTPYTVHSMSCLDNAEIYERYVYYFGENKLKFFQKYLPKELFEGNTGLLFKLTVDDARSLEKIALLCNTNTPTAELELAVALFISRLFAICPEERIEKIGMPSLYIQNVLRFISENLDTSLDGEKIAKKFAVSRSKLDRDFKKFTGKTLHEYIEICKINQAKYLLESKPQMPISEIASVCGFEKENYFFPFFKKATGVTPAEYRKSIINK